MSVSYVYYSPGSIVCWTKSDKTKVVGIQNHLPKRPLYIIICEGVAGYCVQPVDVDHSKVGYHSGAPLALDAD